QSSFAIRFATKVAPTKISCILKNPVHPVKNLIFLNPADASAALFPARRQLPPWGPARPMPLVAGGALHVAAFHAPGAHYALQRVPAQARPWHVLPFACGFHFSRSETSRSAEYGWGTPHHSSRIQCSQINHNPVSCRIRRRWRARIIVVAAARRGRLRRNPRNGYRA